MRKEKLKFLKGQLYKSLHDQLAGKDGMIICINENEILLCLSAVEVDRKLSKVELLSPTNGLITVSSYNNLFDYFDILND